MSETTNVVVPQKEAEKIPEKIPEGNGVLPTKKEQEVLDKVLDVMKNPKHYNITVRTEADNKKLNFITGLKMLEGEFLTDTAELSMKLTGTQITAHVGGIFPDTWLIDGERFYVKDGYDTSYRFADWLWKNKEVY